MRMVKGVDLVVLRMAGIVVVTVVILVDRMIMLSGIVYSITMIVMVVIPWHRVRINGDKVGDVAVVVAAAVSTLIPECWSIRRCMATVAPLHCGLVTNCGM